MSATSQSVSAMIPDFVSPTSAVPRTQKAVTTAAGKSGNVTEPGPVGSSSSQPSPAVRLATSASLVNVRVPSMRPPEKMLRRPSHEPHHPASRGTDVGNCRQEAGLGPNERGDQGRSLTWVAQDGALLCPLRKGKAVVASSGDMKTS